MKVHVSISAKLNMLWTWYIRHHYWITSHWVFVWCLWNFRLNLIHVLFENDEISYNVFLKIAWYFVNEHWYRAPIPSISRVNSDIGILHFPHNRKKRPEREEERGVGVKGGGGWNILFPPRDFQEIKFYWLKNKR